LDASASGGSAPPAVGPGTNWFYARQHESRRSADIDNDGKSSKSTSWRRK